MATPAQRRAAARRLRDERRDAIRREQRAEARARRDAIRRKQRAAARARKKAAREILREKRDAIRRLAREAARASAREARDIARAEAKALKHLRYIDRVALTSNGNWAWTRVYYNSGVANRQQALKSVSGQVAYRAVSGRRARKSTTAWYSQ